MLEVKNIETAYDQVKVLKGVSMSVKKGEVVTLIGNNGAGKTTLINASAGSSELRRAPSTLKERK